MDREAAFGLIGGALLIAIAFVAARYQSASSVGSSTVLTGGYAANYGDWTPYVGVKAPLNFEAGTISNLRSLISGAIGTSNSEVAQVSVHGGSAPSPAQYAWGNPGPIPPVSA